ncbi:But2 domain-containing protein [Trichophyton interdigitale]|nr:But2 domain-containing protein [Trichophyton interdigitale]
MDRKEAPDPEYNEHEIVIPSIEKSIKTIELQANEAERAATAPELNVVATAPPYHTDTTTVASAVSSSPHDEHHRPALPHAPSMSTSQISSASTISRRPLPPGPESRTAFACLSMHMTDRIRLLRFPEPMVPEIIEMIRIGWPRGINTPREYSQSLEIKLNGNPWSPHSWGESRIHARKLMAGLLDGLYQRGWIVKVSVDIGHVDSLFFRYQQPAPPPCIWTSISFHHSDRLRIVDGPTGFGLILADALGPEVENCQVRGTMFDIKLHGSPWRAVGTKTVKTRVILLTIMDVLEQQGFGLYAAINHNSRRSKDSSNAEADTWYCNRPIDWKPGQFVYHG